MRRYRRRAPAPLLGAGLLIGGPFWLAYRYGRWLERSAARDLRQLRDLHVHVHVHENVRTGGSGRSRQTDATPGADLRHHFPSQGRW